MARNMARNLSALLLVSLLLVVDPAFARRAVGRRETVEAVVGARGVVRDDTNEWGEDKADDEEKMPPDGHGGIASSGAASSQTVGEASGESSSVDGVATVDGGTVEGPMELSVRDRGLVTREVSPASILREHRAWHAEEKTKRFAGETLGYVTPWNGRGYDYARTFRSKLDYVSPAWYQLKGVAAPAERNGEEWDVSPGGKVSFTLAGGHDFDEAWVSDVRDGVYGQEDGGVTKIVPRVVIEMHGSVQLGGGDLLKMAELLVQEALLRGYHGFVLDIPLSPGIEQLLAEIARTSSARGIDLLLIQSVRPGLALSRLQLERIVPLVHRFSLMTYDYGATGEAASMASGVPNSPLSWVRRCVETFAPPLGEEEGGVDLRGMLLMGIPFYGYDNGRAMSYDDAVSVLGGRQMQDTAASDAGMSVSSGSSSSSSGGVPLLSWEPTWREHVISYKDRDAVEHSATYPTLAFIEERVALAHELGVGLAVWELGQGMPYFFDLL